MGQTNKVSAGRTIADYVIKKLKREKDGLENAVEFLRAAFLSSAVDALFYARRKAGLTQEQVAQKLGKKQEAIARWEADKEGKMSLRQYFDLAAACGRIPLNIALEPTELVRDFIVDCSEEDPTPALYYPWLKRKSEAATVQVYAGQITTVASLQARPEQHLARNTSTVDSALRYIRDQQSRPNYYSSQYTSSRNVTSAQSPVLNQPQA